MIRKIVFLFFILVLLSGCATIYNPATEREEFVFIDTRSEVALGKMVNGQVRRDHKISQDPYLNQRVKEVGKKVAAVCDRQDLEYQFFVAEDEELNAFSLPGGFVYVNTGLLEKANDEELAAVMAHEIGHVVARHVVKQLQMALGFDIVMSIAFNKSNAVQVFQAVNVVYDLISLGYSREDERQADKLAVIYTYKAKYNPRGMINFFAKLKEEEKKKGNANIPVFLRSHPAIEERIKNIEKEIELVEHPRPPKALPETISVKPPVTPDSKTSLNPPQPSLVPVKNRITRKMCPHCKKIFPSQDNFCPFDGAKLIY